MSEGRLSIVDYRSIGGQSIGAPRVELSGWLRRVQLDTHVRAWSKQNLFHHLMSQLLLRSYVVWIKERQSHASAPQGQDLSSPDRSKPAGVCRRHGGKVSVDDHVEDLGEIFHQIHKYNMHDQMCLRTWDDKVFRLHAHRNWSQPWQIHNSPTYEEPSKPQRNTEVGGTIYVLSEICIATNRKDYVDPQNNEEVDIGQVGRVVKSHLSRYQRDACESPIMCWPSTECSFQLYLSHWSPKVIRLEVDFHKPSK